jgi:prepilin signal peptidase PulO-like enzyme (type II secretory pathway)
MSLTVLTAILFGAALGSFLNVIVLRYPSQPFSGRSYCPKCKKKLSAWELIPIISYLFIRGRCTNCHRKISLQYPLVELLVSVIAVIFLYLFLKDQLSLTGALIQFFIVYLLLALFLIDLRTYLLPDLFITILFGLAVLSTISLSNSILFSTIGALIGSGTLFLLWIITSRRGIGLGDVKLMIPLGLLFGPINTILLLFNSFILGGLVGLILIILKKATMKTVVPFGPFLAGVAIIYIMFPQVPELLLSLIY